MGRTRTCRAAEQRPSQRKYYLQADSNADEWFEDLPEEEKQSWVIIERIFRRRWLNEEEISIKEPVTIETEPQPAPTVLPTSSESTTTTILSIYDITNTAADDSDTHDDPSTVPQCTTPTVNPVTAATASSPAQTTTLSPHHETGTQDIPKVDVEHDESRDVVARSPASLSTTTDSRAHLHQKMFITAENPQDLPQEPSEGTQDTSEPTSPLDFTKNRPISPNASPSPPNLPPNEPISPQPPPNPSTTPLNTSTTVEIPLETSGFTQKRPKMTVFNQNHAKSPKSLDLDENATDF
jgi:hypothetical protein